MTGRRRDDAGDDDDRSFADRMREAGDVEPSRRDRVGQATVVTGPTPVSGATGVAPPPSRASGRDATGDGLRTPDRDEPLFAHRSFVRRRVLRDLRAGRIRPDRTVDLHRLDRRGAERRVLAEISEAAEAGERCVLVVAGRGRHSAAGEPVLRGSLPRWLADAALGEAVVAFAPAIASDGGRGAVYVLLR